MSGKNIQQAFAQNSANLAAKNERKKMSEEQIAIIDRNIVLRSIITVLEHREPLSKEQAEQLSELLSSTAYFAGCEKHYYELVIALHATKDVELKQMAEDFHNRLNSQRA